MKRRNGLILAATGILMALAALGSQKRAPLLLLDWATKAKEEKPVVTVLIELGLKDDRPTPWSNSAEVQGAKVIRREGYRFRDGDKLIEPNGWQASTRLQGQVRGPNAPADRVARPALVGVVLHLGDVEDGATLTLGAQGGRGERMVVRLKAILAGEVKRFWDGN